LLANGWVAWLVSSVVTQIGSARPAGEEESPVPRLAIVALVFIGLTLNGLLIRTAVRMARQFVNSPTPPARPQVGGTWPQVIKAAGLRLLMVVVVQLALFETLEQVSVHWKESTGELWGMALDVASLGGLVWACWPGYRLKRSWVFWAGGTIGSAFLLMALGYFYSLHLRPNLGLYRESEWVAQHPGFQWGWRQGIGSKVWNKPSAAPFGPAVESVLPLDNELPVALFDLDTGRQAARTDFDANDDQTRSRLGADGIDLVAVRKNEKVVVLGLGLAVGQVPHYIPRDTLSSQNVANFWVLDRKPPAPTTDLQLWTNLVGAYVFRTREGGSGLLEFLGPSDNPPGVKIRYKLVQSATSLPTLKPIPPKAVELLAAWKAYFESYAATHDMREPNKDAVFSKESSARIKEIEDLLRGTIADPLLQRQDEQRALLRKASQTGDTARIREAADQLKTLSLQIEKVVEEARKPGSGPTTPN
jgi:hypothetical protein